MTCKPGPGLAPEMLSRSTSSYSLPRDEVFVPIPSGGGDPSYCLRLEIVCPFTISLYPISVQALANVPLCFEERLTDCDCQSLTRRQAFEAFFHCPQVRVDFPRCIVAGCGRHDGCVPLSGTFRICCPGGETVSNQLLLCSRVRVRDSPFVPP